MKNSTPAWLVPVVAIFTLQTLSAFLSRLIPIVAPVMAEEFGWHGSSIGYLSASNAVGGLVILLISPFVLRQVGGTRMLQITLFLGAACLSLFWLPSVGVVLAACFLMGMSNGAANPAGSEVLQRFSPPSMRNLLFSLKQAGVPLGGMMAGLLVPLLIALSSWRAALVVCALMVIVPTVLTWHLNARLDEKKDPTEPRQRPVSLWQSVQRFKMPLTSLVHNPGLLRMAVVGSLFAVPQSCWFAFTVVYLVDSLGYSLSMGGLVFAVMQVGGVIGRVLLGWLSDYLRSATLTLWFAALFSALTTVLMGFTTAEWPVWMVITVAFVAGCSAASWNGVQIAEVARRAPSNLISETAAGAAILVSLVNIAAPTAFAMTVAASGRYDIAFFCVGVSALLVLAVLPRGRD